VFPVALAIEVIHRLLAVFVLLVLFVLRDHDYGGAFLLPFDFEVALGAGDRAFQGFFLIGGLDGYDHSKTRYQTEQHPSCTFHRRISLETIRTRVRMTTR